MGVRDDYAPRFGRQHLSLWSGAFASDYDGSAWELPGHDGFMVTLDHYTWSESVRVACESPRDDENYHRVDAAILAAVAALAQSRRAAQFCTMVRDGLDTNGDDWNRCTVHGELVLGDAYVCSGYVAPAYGGKS